MTRYTVVWHEDALEQLAQIWLDATDRTVIASASSAINNQLVNDADTKGLEVEGGLRELFVAPLQVLFLVSEPDRMVNVLDVIQV